MFTEGLTYRYYNLIQYPVYIDILSILIGSYYQDFNLGLIICLFNVLKNKSWNKTFQGKF